MKIPIIQFILFNCELTFYSFCFLIALKRSIKPKPGSENSIKVVFKRVNWISKTYPNKPRSKPSKLRNSWSLPFTAQLQGPHPGERERGVTIPVELPYSLPIIITITNLKNNRAKLTVVNF